MSVMNSTVRGVVVAADVSAKTAVGAFGLAASIYSGVKGSIQNAVYVRTLERLEHHAGTMNEVHRLAREHIRQCDKTDDLVPSFSKAVAHVLKARAAERGRNASNIRALEYHE